MTVALKKQFKTESHPNEIELGAHSESNLYAGFASPLEDGGIFIATFRHQEVGQRLRVKFTVPGIEQEFEAKVEVQWLRPPSNDMHEPPGFGASFLELAPQARDAILRYSQKRSPIFYSE